MTTAVPPPPAADPSPGRDPSSSSPFGDGRTAVDDGFSPVLSRARARTDRLDADARRDRNGTQAGGPTSPVAAERPGQPDRRRQADVDSRRRSGPEADRRPDRPASEPAASSDRASRDAADETGSAEDPAAEDPATEDPATEDPATEDPATEDVVNEVGPQASSAPVGAHSAGPEPSGGSEPVARHEVEGVEGTVAESPDSDPAGVPLAPAVASTGTGPGSAVGDRTASAAGDEGQPRPAQPEVGPS
ncbi:MAG: hypothetical protein OEV40_29080, partial [Acidimicrobiia bacterium]|nr:hypothetical protein [Acidimicrobiia bacterium]